MFHSDAEAASRNCPCCKAKLAKRPKETPMEFAKRTYCNIRCFRKQSRGRSPSIVPRLQSSYAEP